MAEWIELLEDGEPHYNEKWDVEYICSSCFGKVIGNGYKYCPWCGDKITRTPKERGGEN
jgi:predicted RNA-binding Zn-ribbon protein involved in translation (DUF1610 family)